jgi:hypothetical protein
MQNHRNLKRRVCKGSRIFADECRIAASRLIYVLVSKYLVTIASPPRIPSKDHLIKPHMPALVTHARRKKDFFFLMSGRRR